MIYTLAMINRAQTIVSGQKIMFPFVRLDVCCMHIAMCISSSFFFLRFFFHICDYIKNKCHMSIIIFFHSGDGSYYQFQELKNEGYPSSFAYHQLHQ